MKLESQVTSLDLFKKLKVDISNLMMRSNHEGERLPMFYLPVYSSLNKDAITVWIVPLAPFVLLFLILRDVFWTIWIDLLTFQRLNRVWRIKRLSQLPTPEPEHE